ncbi:solute carrier family 35 member G1-like [Tigriopus californicus]|uniref:solute carrier family 35 member G1-like n=1 Tax=Tigriopus californicus TaxID=6832 RepID=UPI0027D9DCD3|nr:solute carrier family 35 member G1-like [Tigriopus californicus]|eukprot:TCALIF_07171-PB protein Name:"Similar to Slc35g1 Solute carrier family 35 member G1 (Mus musculus)" AED:0.12 eAED:0.12 QI:164/1/1/1/0.75/0.6/5/750/381
MDRASPVPPLATDPLCSEPDFHPKPVITQNLSDVESTATSTGYWPSLRHRIVSCPGVGHGLAALACLAMTAAATIVKLDRESDPFFMAAARNVVIASLSLSLVWAQGISIVPRGKVRLLALRSLCGNTNLLLMYYAIRHLPLGDTRMISASAPIFVTFLARLFLNEACGMFEVFNIILTMSGILVVMQPPILFGESDYGLEYQTHHFVAASMAVIGTLLAAIGMVVTRALRDVNIFVVSSWNGVIGSFPGFIISLCLGTFSIPSWSSVGYLVALGVLSFIGQGLMTAAFRFEEAGIISLARKAEDIVLAFLIQILYFGDIPTILTLLGTVIITVCILISGFRKILEKSAQTPSSLRACLCLPPWENETNSSLNCDSEENGH